MADVPGPGRHAVFEGDVVDSCEGLLPRVAVGNGRPYAVKMVGDPGAIVPCRAQSLDQRQIRVCALDLVGNARLEQVVSTVLDGDLGVGHALGKVLDSGPAAIETTVVAGKEQISVCVVADHMVVDREPGGARGQSVEEVLRLGPGFRPGDVVGGAILRLLRLEDQVPLLVRAEIEQTGRTVIPPEIRVLIHEVQLGIGGVGPVLEVQVHHVPRSRGCRVDGRVDVPQAVVANHRWVFDGDDRVVCVGNRLDQRACGLPLKRRGEGQLGNVLADRRGRSRHKLIAHAIVVEVRISACTLCREVEQAEAVAHEVRQGVGHLQGCANLGPRLSVQAVVEIRFVRAVPEVAVDPKTHGLLFERNALDFLGRIGLGAHHDDRFAVALHSDADEAVSPLQGNQAGAVAVLHIAHFDSRGRRTRRAESTLG